MGITTTYAATCKCGWDTGDCLWEWVRTLRLWIHNFEAHGLTVRKALSFYWKRWRSR